MDITFTHSNPQLQASFFTKLPTELRECCYRAFLESIIGDSYEYDAGLRDLLGETVRGDRRHQDILNVASACKRLHAEIFNTVYREYNYTIHVYPGISEREPTLLRVKHRIRKLMLTVDMEDDAKEVELIKSGISELVELFEGGAQLRELTIMIWSDHQNVKIPGKDPRNILKALSDAFRLRERDGKVNVIDHHFTMFGKHFFSTEQLGAVKTVIEGKRRASKVDWNGINERAPSLCKALNNDIAREQEDDDVYRELRAAEEADIPSDYSDTEG